MSERRYRVGVLGATGLVGRRIVSLVAGHPWFELCALGASERSAGRPYGEVAYGGLGAIPRDVGERIVRGCDAGGFDDCDVLFSALDAATAAPLESALAADSSPTPARAKALNGAAVVTYGEDVALAKLRAEEALELHRALGDAWGAAYAGFLLGQAASVEGEFGRGEELLSESLRGFRDLGDEHYILLATDGLAGIYDELGEFERARPLHEENLRRGRAQSNRRIVALSLDQLASYARDEGRFEDALSMLKESLRILSDLDDRLGIAENLSRVARTLAVAGSGLRAAELLGSSEALYDETGVAVLAWVAKMNHGTLATIRTQLDDAAATQALERGRALTLDEAVALALDS